MGTVGVIPQGIPPFTVPMVSWSDVPPLFVGALAIAVVALADTMSTASAFAARRGEQVRGNQEMIGIGAANIAAGFFQGFPVSTSGSRTAVAEQARSKSQVTGLVGAAVITLVLVFATSAMQYVPQPTLGAIASLPRSPWPTSPERVGCGGSAEWNSRSRSSRCLAWPFSACCPASSSRWACPSSMFSAARGGRTT